MEQAEKEAWQDSAHKYLTLAFDDGRTLTNDDIYSESMELEQAICEETQLKYGGVSSSCFKVRVFANAGTFKGCTFTASLAVDSYTLTLGRFTVDSDTLTDDHGYRDLTCYDALKAVLAANYAAWVDTVTFPTTIKAFRDAFFSHIGITQESGALINDSAKVYGFSGDTISGNNILSAICEANAVFGHLAADGKFRYASLRGRNEGLYPAETLYPSDTLYPRDWASESIGNDTASYYMSTLKYEEYTTKEVTRVQIRTNNNDIGAVVGSEGNDLIIEGNILLNGSSTDELTPIATNVLKAVGGVSYTPCSFDCEYMPWLSLGDGVRVTAPNGDYVGGYILHRTISGITALKETIECKGSEYNSEKANGTNKSIISLQKKTNELERTSEKLSSTITAEVKRATGAEEKLQSNITQTAESITAEVTRATGAEGTLSSRIQQNADAITTKVTQGQVESTIEQKADSIRLKAKNIVWTADNSSMTADGHLTCQNATVSGAITASSGSVGGFNIVGNTLQCNKTGKGEWTGSGVYIGPDGLAIGQIDGWKGQPVLRVDTDGSLRFMKVSALGFYRENQSMGGESGGIIWADPSGAGANNKGILVDGSVDASAQFYVNGEWVASDRRLKNDIESIELEESEHIILSLRPVSYTLKRINDGKRHRGFIAQEVEEVVPEDCGIVGTKGDEELGERHLLSYIEIIADLVNVVQNQEARIAALESQLKGGADAENV